MIVLSSSPYSYPFLTATVYSLTGSGFFASSFLLALAFSSSISDAFFSSTFLTGLGSSFFAASAFGAGTYYFSSSFLGTSCAVASCYLPFPFLFPPIFLFYFY